MRYDAVFFEVDRTLLWVDVDVEGYVEDMAPYATNGSLTVEEARGPLLESLQKHISQNILILPRRRSRSSGAKTLAEPPKLLISTRRRNFWARFLKRGSSSTPTRSLRR